MWTTATPLLRGLRLLDLCRRFPRISGRMNAHCAGGFMKRSMSVSLLLMGTAALTGCGDKEDAVQIYKDVNGCIAGEVFSADECRSDFAAAETEREQTARKTMASTIASRQPARIVRAQVTSSRSWPAIWSATPQDRSIPRRFTSRAAAATFARQPGAALPTACCLRKRPMRKERTTTGKHLPPPVAVVVAPGEDPPSAPAVRAAQWNAVAGVFVASAFRANR